MRISSPILWRCCCGRRPASRGAPRTDRASLRSIGVLSNRLLLWGIAFELALAAIFIYAPPFQSLLGTAPLSLDALVFVLPFPFIVWGADELRRWFVRRRAD